jgi:hypothetical protein
MGDNGKPAVIEIAVEIVLDWVVLNLEHESPQL